MQSTIDLILTACSIGSMILGSSLLFAALVVWSDIHEPVPFFLQPHEPIDSTTIVKTTKDGKNITVNIIDKIAIEEKEGSVQLVESISIEEFSYIFPLTVLGAVFSGIGGGLQIYKISRKKH